MTQYYITQDGDVLDMLAYQYYGKVFGASEFILQNNPHLIYADYILPAGLKVALEKYNISQEVETRFTSFWG
jgi:phage tail protein X